MRRRNEKGLADGATMVEICKDSQGKEQWSKGFGSREFKSCFGTVKSGNSTRLFQNKEHKDNTEERLKRRLRADCVAEKRVVS